jgi:organic radical activating enzyme
MENKLIVAEVFYSIQGEGPTIGTPAVFIRLGGCNLLCKSESWVCDTIEVWKKGKSLPFNDVLGSEQDSVNYMSSLNMGAHLVITGGEPLMQQDAIVDYLNWFREKYKFTPIIEVETNGTIIPNQHMLDKVDYWNVSPKLSNSGMPYEKRVNEAAINTIQTFGRNKVFKFVVSENAHLCDLFDCYGFINEKDVMLMPAGDSVEALKGVRIEVVELCKHYGFRYSDRLHISLYNQKTGV